MKASLPDVEWEVHVWNRLRSEHRASPDDALDRAYTALGAELPVSGLVGFHFMGPPDKDRTLYRLQYALAPRRLVASVDYEFVIEVGPAQNGESLTHQPRFVTVASPDDRVRVLRQMVP